MNLSAAQRQYDAESPPAESALWEEIDAANRELFDKYNLGDTVRWWLMEKIEDAILRQSDEDRT